MTGKKNLKSDVEIGAETLDDGVEGKLIKAARDFGSYASIFAGAGMAFGGGRNFGRKGLIVVGAGLMLLGGRMLYKALTTDKSSPEKEQ